MSQSSGVVDVADVYLRSELAPPPRTLIDILTATAEAHPDAEAIDDGSHRLTYEELVAAIAEGVTWLERSGVRAGDRVGVRMPSGSHSLYVAILSVLAAGAAYVPVDADDPEERAALVFGEADISAIITADGITRVGERRPGATRRPTPDDDAWVIFTSGSTGTPKGVAVSHRSAAAFVDAEARMFLQDNPIGPQDRILAGLSVAFDASCEEMWLAWRHGACLVPAPRALVRSGVDLGPWLVSREVNIISTVPTLAAMWPAEALEDVRLLIFGGEAMPPELAERLTAPDREVWNTYGPTEATVVACAALMDGGPVSIGLPLDGWDLAVVDGEGERVAEGAIGELVIGGVGLARYLDPAKDAEKYAPMPTLGWERAYRSGDLVRLERSGLMFQGRADDQVKMGGRRIELGEVDAALQNLPGVLGGAAAVRSTDTGHQILVGYLVAEDGFDTKAARTELAQHLPAALVPRLALVDELPTRISGKVDRNALPWPLADVGAEAPEHGLTGTAGWVAGLWTSILGAAVTGPDDDFFDIGGGSLAAAQLVTRLRERYPEVTVADLYDHPRLGSLAERLDEFAPAVAVTERHVLPDPAARTVPPDRGDVAAGDADRIAVGDLAGDRDRRARPPHPDRPRLDARLGADPELVVDARRVPAVHHPARPDGDLRDRGASAARRGAPRCLPARRVRAPAAVDRAAPLGGQRRREPVRRTVDGAVRPGAGCARRQRRRPAHAAARDRHARRSATAAASSPRWTCPGTGSTATSCTSAASR